ncbi:MAG: site-specific integrase [Gammaproteobacteria bacterium]
MTIPKDIDPLLVGKNAEIDLIAKEAMLLEASENVNTIRALDNAVKHFKYVYGASLPCTDIVLKKYLVRYAGELSVSTLEQRRVLIGRWHRENGFEHNPNDSEEVRKVMRGIRRKYGRAPKQAKPAPLRIIEKVILNLDKTISHRNEDNHSNRLRSVRDKALLLTTFWFGLRSDELINLRECDINFHWDADTPYFELYLSKSKTDRDAYGRTRKLEALPNLCPMQAIRDWLEISCNGVEVKNYRQSELPLFSKVSRWGKISKTPIHKNSIYKVFIRLIQDAGFDASEYSTHSMRRGIANWIIDSGASVAELKEWIGWSDTRTAMRYLDGKSSLPSKIIERKFKDRLANSPGKDKLEYDAK